MPTQLQVNVFGKTGCKKCKLLQSRLDQLLDQPEWRVFQKTYTDIETEDGMVEFCQAECLNPQRIPAFIVTKIEDGGRRVPLPNPAPGQADPVCGNSRLYQYLGLQTDYSEAGKGLISPKMIQAVLYQAKELADV